MPPRVIYRWKAFWLGVLVIAFLGWAWVRSMVTHEGTWATWRPGGSVAVGQSEGAVFSVWSLHDPFSSKLRFYSYAHPVDWDAPWFPAAMDFSPPDDGPAIMEAAHWFVMLLFLIPWSGLLIWRTRGQKLVARQVIPPPSSQGDAS